MRFSPTDHSCRQIVPAGEYAGKGPVMRKPKNHFKLPAFRLTTNAEIPSTGNRDYNNDR